MASLRIPLATPTRQMAREGSPNVGAALLAAAVAGTVAFGAAPHMANLHGFTALFPWFEELRTPDPLVAHLVFGVVAACAYCEFSRPASDDRHDE